MERAGPHFLGEAGLREAAGQDHLDPGLFPPGKLDQLEAVDAARHHDVGEQEVDRRALQCGQRFRSAGCLQHAIAQAAQLANDDPAQRLAVLDRQDGFVPAGERAVRAHVRLLFLRHVRAGQIEAEGGADADLAIDADMAARLLHEAEHHAEAEAGAVLVLGRIERFEDPAPDLVRHAGAGVGDHDQRIVAGRYVGIGRGIVAVDLAVGGGDGQPPAIRHRIARVGRQVGQRRLKLGRVGHHRADIIGEIVA